MNADLMIVILFVTVFILLMSTIAMIVKVYMMEDTIDELIKENHKQKRHIDALLKLKA